MDLLVARDDVVFVVTFAALVALLTLTMLALRVTRR